MKVLAMIPTRLGSERIKYKNLRLLEGKPLAFYAINNAQKAGIFDDVILNSESPVLCQLAKRYKANFYLRPEEYATSQTKSDAVVYDFLKKNTCDVVFWINPTSPLQDPQEIREGLTFLLTKNLDSLFTVERKQIHSVYQGKALNFDQNGLFPRTQDLTPIHIFAFSFMAWRSDTFIKNYEKNGYAFLCGNTGYFPVSQLSSIDIDYEEDLRFAELILRAKKRKTSNPIFDELYHQNELGD